jgi:hypothetical protein
MKNTIPNREPLRDEETVHEESRKGAKEQIKTLTGELQTGRLRRAIA